MKVLLAKTAGFCFGVKRAVDTVYQQVEKNKDRKIYTFGPIIHNDEVIKDMQAKGVTVLEGEEDLPKAKNGIVIIRSHGVPKRICDRMNELGIQYVDATCPFVKKIHKIAMEKAEEGGRHYGLGWGRCGCYFYGRGSRASDGARGQENMCCCTNDI